MANPPTAPLSNTKNIPLEDRLIFALDVPTHEEARRWVQTLGDSVHFYKLGLQIFLAGDYYGLIQWMRDQGKRIFADLKFFDVPETVRLAVKQLNHRGVQFVTVHGNDSILEAAVSAREDIQILAVTALTSLDRGDLQDLGFQCDPEALVLSRAKRAIALGCDGVVSSGLEAPKLREHLGHQFLVVTPGIRPVDNRTDDDQKRIVTVQQAFRNGADYIVVGRPIKQAIDPKATALSIQMDIAETFGQ